MCYHPSQLKRCCPKHESNICSQHLDFALNETERAEMCGSQVAFCASISGQTAVLAYYCTTCPTTTTTATTTTTTTQAPSGGSSCFPSAARVFLKSGKSVPMSELQVGDHVQIGRHIR